MILSSTDHTSATPDFVAGPAFRWSMLFVGLAVGFLGMDLMVRRPMMRELARVRVELSTVERDMEELVGVRNQVWETNNLLTSLKSQYRQLEDARVCVTAMEQLRKEIEAEAEHTAAAFNRLDRLVGLQNRVLSNSANIETAEEQFERMMTMQEQVVLAGQRTEQAVDSIRGLLKVREAAQVAGSDIDSALATVKQFGALKEQIFRESEGVEVAETEVEEVFATARRFNELKAEIFLHGEGLDAAREHVAGLAAIKNDVFNASGDTAQAHEAARRMIALKNDINGEADGILEAQQHADDLFTLKNDIVQNGGDTQTAFQHTDRLFSLRDRLNADMDLDNAESKLTQLVSIQNTLNSQTGEVVDAIETLEVLTDLSDELQVQVDSMGDMRKSLMDIILLETTVSRAVNVLEPLTQISQLRRMNRDDVRAAARTIMEQRSSRVASREDAATSRASSPRLKLDDVELFTDDEPADILVPAPREDDVNRVIDSLSRSDSNQ